MNKQLFLFLSIIIIAYTTTCKTSNYSVNRKEKKIQSFLLNCGALETSYIFVDTNLADRLSKSLLSSFDTLETVTIIEIASPTLAERKGIILLGPSNKLYQFCQNRYTTSFTFKEGANEYKSLQYLAKFLETNFDEKKDSLIKTYEYRGTADGLYVFVIHITKFADTTNCSYFTIPYKPDDYYPCSP